MATVISQLNCSSSLEWMAHTCKYRIIDLENQNILSSEINFTIVKAPSQILLSINSRHLFIYLFIYLFRNNYRAIASIIFIAISVLMVFLDLLSSTSNFLSIREMHFQDPFLCCNFISFHDILGCGIYL